MKVDLILKVTFQQRLDRGEGVNHGDITGRNLLSQQTVKAGDLRGE